MENKINKFLEELIQEIETELDEATASGAAGAYSTPNAFSDNGSKDKNKKKKIATQLGMKLVGKVNEGKYNYKADALTAYFKGKIDAKELDKIARDDFNSGIATKKELSNFLSNKFTQDVMSDTYGIPTGTLIKRVRGLMKFAEGIGESVNEGYSKHFTYDEVVKSIVDFAKSKGYKIPSKGLDIIKGNPPSGPIRGWSRGTSIPLDKKVNLSFDIYGVGKVFTVNQRLKLNKTFAESTIDEKMDLFVEENVPTDASKWSYYKAQAKKKFDVYPSAYANGWAAKKYKAAGGGWKKKKK